MSSLYLFTLEVAPLNVGRMYNPLPSHLTLMSRFWSKLPPEALVDIVRPLFERTAPIELALGKAEILGPKHTTVHLVEHTQAIRHLHEQLRNLLDGVSVTYTTPQFVGDGHKPHVSRREGDGFAQGHKQMTKAAYLIEVEIHGEQQLRFIRGKFDLTS